MVSLRRLIRITPYRSFSTTPYKITKCVQEKAESAAIEGNTTVLRSILTDSKSNVIENPRFVAFHAARFGHLNIVKDVLPYIEKNSDLDEDDLDDIATVAARYGQDHIVKAMLAGHKNNKDIVLKATNFKSIEAAAKYHHILKWG